MKIYVNVSNQPPTCSAGFSARTDAEGALRVYSSSLGSGVSAFTFKRGTTVPLDVFFPADFADEAAEITKFRFGLKRRGKYDEILVLLCEADGPGETQSDGTVKFSVRPTFSASVIDSELCVNDVSADDLDSAAFVSEFEWENAAGEISATASISTVISNNVVRAGLGGASGMLSHPFAALMVIRMSWAEYCALDESEIIADALYVVPDAPNEVEEHNADENAHPALRAAAYNDAAALADDKIADAKTDLLAAMDVKIAAAEENFSSGNQAAVDAATAAQAQLTQILANYTEQTGAIVAAAVASEKAERVEADNALLFGTAAAVQRHADLHADETPLTESANHAAWFGSFAALGCAGTTLIPKKITFYRRANNAGDNHTLALYLRILRKNEAGDAWTVAYQSSNAVRAQDQTLMGSALTPWTLENKDGRGAIPADEDVLIVQVQDAAADVATRTTFGAAVCMTIPGSLNPNTADATLFDASATLTAQTFSPAMDVEYLPGDSLAARIAALEEKLKELLTVNY